MTVFKSQALYQLSYACVSYILLYAGRGLLMVFDRRIVAERFALAARHELHNFNMHCTMTVCVPERPACVRRASVSLFHPPKGTVGREVAFSALKRGSVRAVSQTESDVAQARAAACCAARRAAPRGGLLSVRGNGDAGGSGAAAASGAASNVSPRRSPSQARQQRDAR